jgi:hypothetical protein
LPRSKEAGWKIDLVSINDLKIKPCQACDACAKDGRCIVQDDMQTVYPKVIESDAMVVASPITFGSMNAQLKAFIDRFQCWWHAKYNLKTPFIAEDAKHPGFLSVSGPSSAKNTVKTPADRKSIFPQHKPSSLPGSSHSVATMKKAK